MADEMLLVLQGIHERKDGKEARNLFQKWCAWVQGMLGKTGD